MFDYMKKQGAGLHVIVYFYRRETTACIDIKDLWKCAHKLMALASQKERNGDVFTVKAFYIFYILNVVNIVPIQRKFKLKLNI